MSKPYQNPLEYVNLERSWLFLTGVKEEDNDSDEWDDVQVWDQPSTETRPPSLNHNHGPSHDEGLEHTPSEKPRPSREVKAARDEKQNGGRHSKVINLDQDESEDGFDKEMLDGSPKRGNGGARTEVEEMPDARAQQAEASPSAKSRLRDLGDASADPIPTPQHGPQPLSVPPVDEISPFKAKAVQQQASRPQQTPKAEEEAHAGEQHKEISPFKEEAVQPLTSREEVLQDERQEKQGSKARKKLKLQSAPVTTPTAAVTDKKGKKRASGSHKSSSQAAKGALVTDQAPIKQRQYPVLQVQMQSLHTSQQPRGAAADASGPLLLEDGSAEVRHITHAGEEAGKAILPGGRLRAFANPDELEQTKDEPAHVDSLATNFAGDPQLQTPPDAVPIRQDEDDMVSIGMEQANELATQPSREQAHAPGAARKLSHDVSTVQASEGDPILVPSQAGAPQARSPDASKLPQGQGGVAVEAREPHGNVPSDVPKPVAKPVRRGLQPIPDSSILDPDPDASRGSKRNPSSSHAGQRRGLRPIPDSTITDPTPAGRQEA